MKKIKIKKIFFFFVKNQCEVLYTSQNEKPVHHHEVNQF